MKKDELGDPPEELAANEVIAKVVQNRGNTFDVSVSESQLAKVEAVLGESSSALLVGLGPALKHKIFVKRNGYVVVTLEKLGPNGKISGEITNVVGDTRYWQRHFPQWPPEYGQPIQENSMLDLPPSDSEEEY